MNAHLSEAGTPRRAHPSQPARRTAATVALALLVAGTCAPTGNHGKGGLGPPLKFAQARIADRGRVVKARKERSAVEKRMDARPRSDREASEAAAAASDVGKKRRQPHRPQEELPIEGPRYRGRDRRGAAAESFSRESGEPRSVGGLRRSAVIEEHAPGRFGDPELMVKPEPVAISGNVHQDDAVEGGPFDPVIGEHDDDETFRRRLSSQLTGCCTTYSSYTGDQMCELYGQDCSTGQEPSHDSGDEDCSQEGLSFIGVSFSVNSAQGNPYSYQLCDQFPMENIIDRDYSYVMSMDEDGWLVGGGYKSFDYSGKMPYMDSSHTELLRVGSIDPNYGGTSIEQVYAAMNSVSFPPFGIFPEYVKGGGGHNSGDDEDESVPSSDVTLIVSVVDSYEEDNNYSTYEEFLDDLFEAMEAVGGGPCMDDHDTDPHVSMSRGVKFKSSYHQQEYFYKANLEVAVWQAMYPTGVVIGTSGIANFPPDQAGKNRHTVGYGNLYFFFDRANITKAFNSNRELSTTEEYYSTLYNNDGAQSFYDSVSTVDFDYSGSGSGDNDDEYEHNPYSWNAEMAKHDMTDGWELPPNCEQEGEAFFGIPLSRASASNLQKSSSFQEQFDFDVLLDRNFTYVKSFGTNHGWLIGEEINNGAGSIVDKDTAHIPLFYTGTSNPDMGGMSLSNLVKVARSIEFGTLYIKPAFVFQDDDGALKLQFEADANSALAYLYDNLCKLIGIAWNYDKPYNDLGVYTNCAMHAAGDRAKYGCGPDNANSGGFCPQMTIAYSVGFQSEDHAAAYMDSANNYVDYWRSLYPNGVAVGTSNFCPEGGCLGFFLNRYDLYNVYKPDLGGTWVSFNGGTVSPTISPAPTWNGGCDDPHNSHLDRCFRKQHSRKAAAQAWDSLGTVGQVSVILIAFMATTLSISLFLSRARKKKRRGESYVGFFVRDMAKKGGGKKKKKLKKRRSVESDLMSDDMFSEDNQYQPPPPPRSARTSRTTKSGSRSKSKDRGSASSARGRSQSKSRSKPPPEGGDDGASRKTSRTSRSREPKRSKSRDESSKHGSSAKVSSKHGSSASSKAKQAGSGASSRSRSQSKSRGRSKSGSRSQSRARSASRSRNASRGPDSEAVRKSTTTSKRRQLV